MDMLMQQKSSSSNKISVLIMSQNNQETIRRTLESVKEFDEIIIADGGSTDATLEICREYNVRVLKNKFVGFAEQRNFLLKNATYEWSLMVDSDEAVTPELKQELYRLISQQTTHSLYRIMRTEYISHQEIKSGLGSSDYQDRFFKTAETQYTGKVHEHPLIGGRKLPLNDSRLFHINSNYRLLHDPSNSISRIIKKFGSYVSLSAKSKIEQKRTTNPFIIILSFIGTFFQIYFKNRKAGRRGFMIAVLEANNRCMVKVLIYEHQMLVREGLLKK